jgi:large subunit ribosomal protein L1
MARRMSKRTQGNLKRVPQDAMDPASAISALKKFDGPKFDQSVEIAMHLGIDTKQADQQIRGSVSLPNGIGKAKRVIAFCQQDVARDAIAAGAVKAGGEDLVAEINAGFMDFDVAVSSPDMMRVISTLGKVLGPKGLMPSPKNGTVTKDVASAVAEFAAGKVEYRADKAGNIHAVIGKMSFSEADLLENMMHFVSTIERARPQSLRGEFVRNVSISGSMTPGVRVKLAAAEAAV